VKKHEQPVAVEECLQCKVIGVLALSSIAAYMGYLRINTPKYDKKQRLFLAVFGVGKKQSFPIHTNKLKLFGRCRWLGYR
jgi:hypothetical protein